MDERANHYSMTEFATKIDRLTERLRRSMAQYDQIEQRTSLVEERFSLLNESVQTLARLIEVSLLILISSDKEKFIWLQLSIDKNLDLTDPKVEQFFYRLELYLRRSIIDKNEKQAYIRALSLVCTPPIVS